MNLRVVAVVIIGAMVAVTATPVALGAALLHMPVDAERRVALTVYSDFALIRDVRNTTLPVGLVDVDFEAVAQTIDPSSVRVRSINHEDQFEVLQQSYEFDLLNKRSVLERYIGKKLKYSRSVLSGDQYEKVLREGILLSIDPEIVQFGDEIEIGPEGVISLPYIPYGLKTTPTLVWRAQNQRRGPQQIETSYLAEGIGWSADYLMTLNDSETRFDLSSWVRLQNETGVSYENASLKLVAGEVRRERVAPTGMASMQMARAELADMMQVQRTSLSDYYLYDFPTPVTLRQKENKQLRFIDATGIRVQKHYVAVAGVPVHQMSQPQQQQFQIRYGFDNRGPLGEPLPAGRVRVMRADGDGDSQLLGEGRIRHTPRGESVELVVGEAFDLTIKRTQKDWRRLAERTAELTMAVEVANRKDEAADVVVQEKLYGDWQAVKQTLPGEKIDSSTLEFRLKLRAGEVRNFSYTVRTTF